MNRAKEALDQTGKPHIVNPHALGGNPDFFRSLDPRQRHAGVRDWGL